MKTFPSSLDYSVCITATFSELSASWFRAEQISLTSSFAQYKQPVSYPAKNTNRDIIGAILSDGVAVSFSNVDAVKSYYLCIEQNQDYVKSTDLSLYSVYDFGKSQVNATIAQNFTVYFNGTQVCAYITPQSTEEIYFVIIRIADLNGSIDYFSKSTVGMLYTLAVLFLLCSIYGLLILGIVMYQVIIGEQTFKIQLFVVLVCLFSFNLSMFQCFE